MEKKRIKKVVANKPIAKKNGKVKAIKTTSISKITENSKIRNERTFSFLGFMNDFAQALVITAVMILLTVSFMIVGGQKKSEEIIGQGDQSYFGSLDNVKIIKKGKGFFGTLVNSAGIDAVAQESDSVLGMGSAGGMNLGLEEKRLVEGSSDIAIMPPMEIVKYNYVYVGDDFPLFPSEVDVYKRVNPDLSREFASSFANKKISFFDMNKFRNISISNLSINEEVDYGYSINLGLRDGSFSMYKNWEKWPNIDKLCRGDNECYQNSQLSVGDILDDKTIVSISDQFLSDYGIPLDNYGEGEVQKQWLENYINSPDKKSFYIPDTISVIYPLKIEGREIYEEYGQKFGLTVEVDMREKRVSGLFNLFYQYYESSYYTSESNKDNILKMVSQGGMYPDYGYYREEDDVKELTIEIGTPALEMVKLWHYDEEKMMGSEIYVPAYVFPIISGGDEPYFYKKNIVIPAVKDFFDTNRYIVPLLDLVKSSVDSVEIDIEE
ncbi:MAG: hypothetical protein PHP37_02240 [Patescibacteria group bacterium]|nr:hypothetical protein [Patescibacteria group bacterium]